MDTRSLERQRPALLRPVNKPVTGPVMRAAAALAVAALLALGVAGGLLRAGVPLPASAGFGAAAVWHAALMMSGCFGTVIALERAVALKRRGWLAVPLLAWLGAVALWSGAVAWGQGLGLLAAAGFVAMNAVILRREPALHTALLALGALAWGVGQGLFLLQGFSGAGEAVIAWWAVFLVLTVAAERLEMARLTRQGPRARATLLGGVALLLAGATLDGLLFGIALAALAVWLLCCDIARRTVRTHGASRYMAACLLAGHGWLLVAGLAWGAHALGHPTRDVALHALGLGFLVSMVMGHAIVILPALARVKVLYGAWFYGPFVLLQLSLAWRFVGRLSGGAVANAAALVLFAITLLGSAIAWRRRHGGAPSPRRVSRISS